MNVYFILVKLSVLLHAEVLGNAQEINCSQIDGTVIDWPNSLTIFYQVLLDPIYGVAFHIALDNQAIVPIDGRPMWVNGSLEGIKGWRFEPLQKHPTNISNNEFVIQIQNG